MLNPFEPTKEQRLIEKLLKEEERSEMYLTALRDCQRQLELYKQMYEEQQ